MAEQRKIPTKACNTCEEEKPFTDYNKCAANIGGLRNDCRSCQNKYNEARNRRLAAQGLNTRGKPRKRKSKYGEVRDSKGRFAG